MPASMHGAAKTARTIGISTVQCSGHKVSEVYDLGSEGDVDRAKRDTRDVRIVDTKKPDDGGGCQTHE